MSVPSDFLRMCIDCQHSRIYQAANHRNVWFYCEHHKVTIHYNESCENYLKMREEIKKTRELAEFPDKPPMEGIP